MAICSLTTGYLFGCDIGAGGTKEAWLIELDNITSFTESSGVLTAITKASGKVFRKYQLVQDTAQFGEDITGNIENGTLFYAQRGTIILNKQQVAVRNEIMLLAKNRLGIIIRDNNESYRLYGRVNGMRLLGGTAETGTTWGDRNGYTLNFTGKEAELAPFVLESVIATLET